MAAAWAMRRDGSFVVELFTPLNYNAKPVDHLILQPTQFEHNARWNRKEIPSALALLAELTGLPERVLRQAVYPDMDRITIALFAQAKFAQQAVLVDGEIPFATPEELLPPPQESGVGDQVDPRFPHVDGPVRRFPTPPPGPFQPPPPPPAEDNLDLGIAAPNSIKAAI